MTNIVKAIFGAMRTAQTRKLHQWDYGQILQFVGPELPDAYTVHFANEPAKGEAKTQIGDATGVAIPDEYLATGATVYAWVYLHTGADDGETVYTAVIPVIPRPRPTEDEPTPEQRGLIDTAIAALNSGVETVQDGVETVHDGVETVLDAIKTVQETVDTALQEAKDSGEFDGPQGPQGEIGPTPEITIGDVTTGEPGTDAAVTIRGTAEAPVIDFTIPRGNTGNITQAVRYDAVQTLTSAEKGQALENIGIDKAVEIPNLFNPETYDTDSGLKSWYIGDTGDRAIATTSTKRLMIFPAEAGHVYNVILNKTSIKRVGYTTETPDVGVAVYDYHETAKTQTLNAEVTVGTGGQYIVLQLYAASDTDKTPANYFPYIEIYDLTAGASAIDRPAREGVVELENSTVSHAEAQTLTEAQKKQARENIGAMAPADHYALFGVPGNIGGAMLARDKLSSYWTAQPSDPQSYDDDSYIETRIDAVPDGDRLLFFTDEHWEVSSQKIHPLLSYVRSRLNIGPVLNGGDTINGVETKYLARQVASASSAPLLAEFAGHYFNCMGNHDTNLANVDDATIAEARYYPPSMFVKTMVDPVLMRNAVYPDKTEQIMTAFPNTTPAQLAELTEYFKLTYYVDRPEIKTRILVVNTGATNYGVVKDVTGVYNYMEMYLCADFIYKALLTTPEGYNVIALGHWMLKRTDDMTDLEILTPARSLARMMSALKRKVTENIRVQPNAMYNTDKFGAWKSASDWWPSSTNKNCNFTTANDVGKVMILSGHIHSDELRIATNGGTDIRELGNTPVSLADGEVPIVVTQTDCFGRPSASGRTSPMTEGTVTEQAFDVITLTDNAVHFTRFGSGSDRVIEFE